MRGLNEEVFDEGLLLEGRLTVSDLMMIVIQNKDNELILFRIQ